MNSAPPRGKAWERICFVVAAFAALGAAQAFGSDGFGEDCFAGLARAAVFVFAGGFLRHQRKIADFKRSNPGWSEMGHVRGRK